MERSRHQTLTTPGLIVIPWILRYNLYRFQPAFAPQLRLDEFNPSADAGTMQLRTLPALVGLLLMVGQLARGAEPSLDDKLPVRGFCIAAPPASRLEEFLKLIEEELAPRSVNTLILRVDYGFQFQSRPEMADPNGLTRDQAKAIVERCRKHRIRIVPLVNLLGHQSWQSSCGRLLKLHPEFDETPEVKFPEKYAWPNADRLYCKSYCPLHPEVHEFVFALVDEVCDAFEADTFHAGMDEVFYLGEDQCPRCRGQNKAELFAGEVKAIREHLRPSGRQLWIWGDRLLDGRTTGLGEWEASFNDTHPAVDLIPKDVVICDWHYERADQTPVYFATKGLSVVSCSWKNPDAAAGQVRDMLRFRESSTRQMKQRFLGVAQTVWSGAGGFLDQFHGRRSAGTQGNPDRTESKCFERMFEEIARLE